jgi:hypothetical protein
MPYVLRYTGIARQPKWALMPKLARNVLTLGERGCPKSHAQFQPGRRLARVPTTLENKRFSLIPSLSYKPQLVSLHTRNNITLTSCVLIFASIAINGNYCAICRRAQWSNTSRLSPRDNQWRWYEVTSYHCQRITISRP